MRSDGTAATTSVETTWALDTVVEEEPEAETAGPEQPSGAEAVSRESSRS